MIYWRSCESSAFRAAALFLCPFSSTPPCRKIKGFPDVQQDGAQLRQGSVRRTCTHYRFALANARSNPALGKANGAFCGRPLGPTGKMWSESPFATEWLPGSQPSPQCSAFERRGLPGKRWVSRARFSFPVGLE